VAGKGRQSWEKRQREKSKRERQEAKRADRLDRKTVEEEPESEGPSEAELYERFAKLSEAHAAGNVDDEVFEERKAELFEALGLEVN
jgi:hypothetical protein